MHKHANGEFHERGKGGRSSFNSLHESYPYKNSKNWIAGEGSSKKQLVGVMGGSQKERDQPGLGVLKRPREKNNHPKKPGGAGDKSSSQQQLARGGTYLPKVHVQKKGK